MGQTYWYARAQFDATPSGPYYETRDAVPVADGERLRPIDESVLPADADIVRPKDAADPDDGDGGETVPITEVPLADLDSHEALKARAEAEGIADDIDLRSKASIREALHEHATGVGDDEQ